MDSSLIKEDLPIQSNLVGDRGSNSNSGSHESTETSASSSEPTWIGWFISMQGNEFFCEIERGFIEDAFNLYGIKQIFPFDFNRALSVILDKYEGMINIAYSYL